MSLLFLIDALYDSKADDIIVIDEPELSMHPAFQRRLAVLFSEYAKTRQIIISTHSPYFVDIEALGNGARLARVHFGKDGSTISELSPETGIAIQKLLSDQNNPHVLGLDAREAFFLDERVILVEGQDDVIQYPRVAKALGIDIPGTFFGWGAGGAEKMPILVQLLKEIGFAKVAGILDHDKVSVATRLTKEFPEFLFGTIPTDDVRNKRAVAAKSAKIGLLDDSGLVRPEYEHETRTVFHEIQAKFK